MLWLRIANATLVLACIACVDLPAGTVNEYTSSSAWTGISGATVVGTESFGGFSGFVPSPASGTTGSLGGGVVWSASAPGGLFVDTTGSTTAFSTNGSDTVNFAYTYSAGLSGVGGFFYPTDLNFNVVPATIQITVTLSDLTAQSFTRAIVSAGEFWGFHSPDAAIASVSAKQTSSSGLYPAVSNMSLMTGGLVPEPSTGCMVLAGLSYGAWYLVRWRRRMPMG